MIARLEAVTLLTNEEYHNVQNVSSYVMNETVRVLCAIKVDL